MKIKKTLKPGDAGTKKWVERFGEDLVSVRYRYDKDSRKVLTTAEIIVERRAPKSRKSAIPANRIMFLRVDFEEIEVRRLVKKAGGAWNKELQVWELAYREVAALGLESRIVKLYDTKDYGGFKGVSEPAVKYGY